MEKALKSGSEIIVNINQRPVRKLKENSFITIFLEFSKSFLRSKNLWLSDLSFTNLHQYDGEVAENEYCEMVSEDINDSLFLCKRFNRANIKVPQYILDGMKYFADEAYSEILSANDLHGYYCNSHISF